MKRPTDSSFCRGCGIAWSLHDNVDDCAGARSRVAQLEELENSLKNRNTLR